MSFKISDLVWAKMKGFPSWPATIVDPPSNLPNKPAQIKDYYCVFFFHTRNYSWIETKNLKLLDLENIPKKKGALLEALKEAIIFQETKDLSIFLNEDKEEGPQKLTLSPNIELESPTIRLESETSTGESSSSNESYEMKDQEESKLFSPQSSEESNLSHNQGDRDIDIEDEKIESDVFESDNDNNSGDKESGYNDDVESGEDLDSETKNEIENDENLEIPESEIDEADSETGDATSEISDVEFEDGEAESEVGDAESEVGDAESEVGDAESEISGAESEVSDAESEVCDAESEVSDAESEVSDAESEEGDTESEVSDAESEDSDAESEVCYAEYEVGDAESEVGEAESEVGDAESEDGDGESEDGDAESEDGDAESEVGEAESEVCDAESEVGDAESEVGDAESEVGDPESEVSDAESEVDDAESEVCDAESEVYDAESEVGDAESEVCDAESEVGDAEFVVGDAESEVGDAESEVGDAESEVGDAESEVGDAESEVGDAESEVGDAESEVGDAESEVSEAESEIGDVESADVVDDVEDSWESLSDEEIDFDSDSTIDIEDFEAHMMNLNMCHSRDSSDNGNIRRGWIECETYAPTRRKVGFVGSGTLFNFIQTRIMDSDQSLFLYKENITDDDKFPDTVKIVRSKEEIIELCELIFCCEPDPLELKRLILFQPPGRDNFTNKCFIDLCAVNTAEVVDTFLLLKDMRVKFLEVTPFETVIDGDPDMILTVCGAYPILRRCLPVLFTISRHIMYIGDVVGSSSLCYLVTQSMSAGFVVAVAELLHLMNKRPTDKESLLKIFEASMMNNPMIVDKIQMMFKRDFNSTNEPISRYIEEVNNMLNLANFQLPRMIPMFALALLLEIMKMSEVNSRTMDIASIYKYL